MEQQIPIEQIRPNPGNVRQQLGDLAELQRSIAQVGVLQPLVVAPADAEGRHMLIAGHRRRAAAEAAGLTELPCVVRDQLATRETQLVAMLGENLLRADISPVEEATAYQELLSFPGWDAARIAEQVGRAKSTVRSRLRLVGKLGEATLGQLHTGQITVTQAEALAEFAGTRWEKQLTDAVGLHRWDWDLAQARQEREADKKIAKARKRLAADGLLIVNDDPSLSFSHLSGLVDATTGQNLDPEAHRSCPGHAAYLTYLGEAEPVCVNPTGHGHAERWDYLSEQRAQADAERDAERARLTQDLRTAGELRAGHLRRILAAGTLPNVGSLIVGTWLDEHGEAPYVSGEHAAAALELLGKPIRDADDAADASDAVRFLACDRGLVVVAALVAATYEDELTDPRYPARWGSEPYRDYLAWLQNSGYDLSDFEQQLLDQYASELDPSDGAVDECDTGRPVESVELPEATCRVCGCSDEAPCSGGCQWIPDPSGAGDLCSRCAPTPITTH